MSFRFTNLIILLITMLLANTALSQQGPGLQWVGAMGGRAGSSSWNFGRSITTDDQFNVYVTGYFTDTIDFDFSSGTTSAITNGGSDIFIQKLDFAGNLIWAKTIGGTWSDDAFDLKLDASGNVYVTGIFYRTVDFDPGSGVHNLTPTTSGGHDGFLLKLDNSGNFVWVKQIGSSNGTVPQKMALDSLNNIYLTGYFQDITDLDPGTGISNYTTNGNVDIFVEKLDSNGIFLWANSMGGILEDWGTGISVDHIGNVFLTGHFQNTVDFNSGTGVYNLTSNGMRDIFVQKLDPSGNFLWAKSFGGSVDDGCYDLALDSLSNVYVSGYFLGSVDFDPGTGVNNQSSYTLLHSDAFIHKLDSAGNFQWVNIVGIIGSDYGYSVTIGENGGLYFGSLLSSGGSLGLIQKLDYSGNVIWADSLLGFIRPYGLHVDNQENIYSTGRFRNTADFDPGTGVYNLTSGPRATIYVLKLSDCIPSIDTFTIAACSGYTWGNGVTYNTDTTLSYTFINLLGCDSLVNLNLTVTPNDTITQTFTRCDSLLWIDGNVYRNSTIAYHTVSGVLANGCDSVYTLNLTINSTENIMHLTSCDSLTWIDGITYTASNNTASVTYTNVLGCDSTIVLDLTVNYSSSYTDTILVCGSSYTWIDGNAYTASNSTATHVLTNTASCDSVVTLNLTLNPIYSLTETYTACDSFTWSDGVTYSASNNTAVQNLTSIGGCDSTVSLDLTINNSNSQTDNITACGSYTWIDGTTYTASNNTASMTFTNTTGCDSVINLNLTLHVADTTVTRQGLILTANASLGSFQWLDCANNYAVISGETSASYTVTQSGSYALEVTLNGCVDTSSCYVFTNVGVNDIQINKDIRVYPNPTANFITIDLQKVNASKAVITVVNFSGQTVFQESITKDSSPWTKQVDMSNFASGVYFVKVAIGGDEFVYQVSRL